MKQKFLYVIFFILHISILFAQGGSTSALFGDGTSRYLDAGNNYKYAGDFTIEMWVFKETWSVTTEEVFISCREAGGYSIAIEDNGSDDKIIFAYRDGSVYRTISYSISGLENGWHHITGTHSTTDADLYVDGINTDGDGSTITFDSDNHLFLGAEASGGSSPEGRYFDGYIDEVRIWDRVLSQNELHEWRHKQITSDQRPSYHGNLQGYYKMDTDWIGNWLDDAANNVTSNTEVDLTNNLCEVLVMGVPIGNFPAGYTTDAEALWKGTGTGWTEESNGLSLQNASGDFYLTKSEFYTFANNGITGTTITDMPDGIELGSSTIWFIDDYSSIDVNLRFDLSDFGAEAIEKSGLPASKYKLLRRTSTTGEFSEVASAVSIIDGEITFENFDILEDAYYSIGRNPFFQRLDLSNAYFVHSIEGTDIDNDGAIDLLGAASYTLDEIVIWKNDGSENFARITVDGSFDDAASVYAADFDNDGDLDVVGAAHESDDIAWWENDGNEIFTKHMIDDNFDGANHVYAVDVDGDGDEDVLGSADNDADIAWWENNGSGSFSKRTIDGSYSNAKSVYATDVDRDGDIDILGAAYGTNEITWWENDGNENFVKHTIDSGYSGAESVYAADVDCDGDIDVLGAGYIVDDITWWENDGNENFAKHTIDGSLDGACDVFATDVNGDGDIDILGVGYNAYDIVYYENDGSENFTAYIVNDNYNTPFSVSAADVDSDGDIDLLTSTNSSTKACIWFQGGSTTKTTSFTDGSSFNPSVSGGQSNQAIGRFYLETSQTFSLTDVEIKLSGTRAGYSDFRLWQSSDAAFDSAIDIQLGCMVEHDPGTDKTIKFTKGFVGPISTNGSYFFLTCDLAADASGEIEPFLVSNSSLGFSGGKLDGTLNNSSLSNGAISPLPVELINFNAYTISESQIILNWQTATELNNYGFEVERQNGEVSSQNSEWEKVGFVEGSGNSNSIKEYSFIDNSVTSATYSYRLKQIDIDGNYKYSEILSVEICRGESLPQEFALHQNYPNPFNPATNICYSIPVAALSSLPTGRQAVEAQQTQHVTLKVYDILGNEITTLVNKNQPAGNYEVTFNAADLASGVYLYKLQTSSGFIATRKLVLLR